MLEARICYACHGEGTNRRGDAPCAVCKGDGARLPKVTDALLRALPESDLATAAERGFEVMSLTRSIAPRVLIASFIARVAGYQASRACDHTLAMLRGRGFAMIANAKEAELLTRRAAGRPMARAA